MNYSQADHEPTQFVQTDSIMWT